MEQIVRAMSGTCPVPLPGLPLVTDAEFLDWYDAVRAWGRGKGLVITPRAASHWLTTLVPDYDECEALRATLEWLAEGL